MKQILIIVAHADDETIGMGATIAKHVAAGDQVSAISLTNGTGSRVGASNSDALERRQFAEVASEILGFEWIRHFDFPDNKLDTVPLLEIAMALEEIKRIVQPQIVYTHSPADLNVDHRRAFEATLVAFRPEPKERLEQMLLFEVLSATNFAHPGLTSTFNALWFENIDVFWSHKQRALEAYGAELREFPHSRSIRSIESLAIQRGTQVGFSKAEAFDIVRALKH